MKTKPWILISILILLILFAVLAVIINRKRKRKPDYYAFFIIGIIWLIAGIPVENHALSGMGLVFAVVGLAHRKQWKENRRKWENMDKTERIFFLSVVILLGILVLAGLVVWFLANKGIMIR